MGEINNPTGGGGGGGGLTVTQFDVGTLGIPSIAQLSPFTGNLLSANLMGQKIAGNSYGANMRDIGDISIAAGGSADQADPTSAVPIFRVQRRAYTIASGASGNSRDVNGFTSRFARTSNGPFFPWILWYRFGLGNVNQKNDGRFFMGAAPNSDLDVTAAGGVGAFVNVAGIGKEDADANIQFIYNDNAGLVTKVDTGYVYANSLTTIFDLFVSFNGTDVAIRLDDLINTVTSSNSANANIPSLDTRLNLQFALGGGSLSAGFATLCLCQACYYQPIG